MEQEERVERNCGMLALSSFRGATIFNIHKGRAGCAQKNES
jgi:hypothetical protein